jgi:hypothetical protein
MGGFSVVQKAAAGSGKRENGDGNSYVHSQHRRSKRYSFQTYLSIVTYYLWSLLTQNLIVVFFFLAAFEFSYYLVQDFIIVLFLKKVFGNGLFHALTYVWFLFKYFKSLKK